MVHSTLVIVKPDAVSKDCTTAIEQRLTAASFRIRRVRRFMPSLEVCQEHYIEHKDRDFYSGLCQFLASGEVVAMEVTSEDPAVVTLIRGMLGRVGQKGTLRGDFGTSIQQNAVHASDSGDAAKREIALWFPS